MTAAATLMTTTGKQLLHSRDKAVKGISDLCMQGYGVRLHHRNTYPVTKMAPLVSEALVARHVTNSVRTNAGAGNGHLARRTRRRLLYDLHGHWLALLELLPRRFRQRKLANLKMRRKRVTNRVAVHRLPQLRLKTVSGLTMARLS